MKKGKTPVKNTSRKRTSVFPIKITLHRIFVYGSLAVLFVTGVAILNEKPITKSVAGISIARPLFNEATVYWSPVENASFYNVYYKRQEDAGFTYSVSVKSDTTSSVISYLRKGVTYEYRISAADSTGREFFWSGTNKITGLKSM